MTEGEVVLTVLKTLGAVAALGLVLFIAWAYLSQRNGL